MPSLGWFSLALFAGGLALAPDVGAQQKPLARAPEATGEIHGRLADAGGNPIGSGSVTVRRQLDSSFAGGALVKPDGSFTVDGLLPGTYTLRSRVLGYAPLVRAGIAVGTSRIDIGVLKLDRVAAVLSAQHTVEERADVVLAPDRNIYATKNMTAAAGGNGIDVLRNIPAVSIDANNVVSLRNNANVVIQINGRTSPLKGEQLGSFLQQLPASTLKQVEVVTNPSAKNDPEGTAGIINIVLNQDVDVGFSGGFNVTGGSTGQMSTAANIGRQVGKFIGYVQAFGNRDERASSSTTSRTWLLTSDPAFTESSVQGQFRPRSGGAALRSEYRFTEIDALSLDAFAYTGRYPGSSVAIYDDLATDRSTLDRFVLSSDRMNGNHSTDVTLAFRRGKSNAATTFSSELRYSVNSSVSDVALASYPLVASPTNSGRLTFAELDHSPQRYPQWIWQVDYTTPPEAKTKLETGTKLTRRNTNSEFTASLLDSLSGTYQPDPSRDNIYRYGDDISAAYAVVSRAVGKTQLQGGLRLEHTHSTLELPSLTDPVVKSYGSAFPSATVSYHVTDAQQVKASYSRRITRPSPWQLSPIENRTPRAVSRGNPMLAPEYTDALELNLEDSHGWGSMQLSPYLRRTNNSVEYIRQVDTSGVSVSTFDNVARETTLGADFNLTVRHGPTSIMSGVTLNHTATDASNLAGIPSTRAFSWSANLNATQKLSPLADLQLNGYFSAPYTTVGGRNGASIYTTISARYRYWKDKGSISLRVSDPFGLQHYDFQSTSPSAVEFSSFRFQQRAVVLTISRTFGEALKLRPQSSGGESAGPPVGGP